MVAPQFLRSRTAAVLVLLALTLPALPLAVAAGSPPPPTATGVTFDLYVQDGTATVFDSTGKPTSFLSNGTRGTVRVPIYNYGTSAANSIPVIFFFESSVPDASGNYARDPNIQKIPGKCVSVNVPGFQGGQPGNTTASWEFDVPRNYPAIGYNITVLVNNAPPPGTDVGTCPASQHGSLLGAIDTSDATDNMTRAYFVKDLKVDYRVKEIHWCEGRPSQVNPCDEDMLTSSGGIYNRTYRDPDENVTTYFEVVTENIGDWVDDHDYSCDCETEGFRHNITMTIRGPFVNGTEALNATTFTHRGTGPHRAAYWDIGRGDGTYFAGNYTVSATIDPTNSLPEMSEANNVGSRTIEVAFAELHPSFDADDFGTSSAKAYPLGEFRIKGDIIFENNGSYTATTDLLVYVDSPTSNLTRRISGEIFTNASTPPPENPQPVAYTGGPEFTITNKGNQRVVTLDWYATTSPSQTYSLSRGRHTLYAVIDPDNTTTELDDNNNIASIDLYVADDSKPVLDEGSPKISYTSVDKPAVSLVRPAEKFNVHINLTDDDLEHLDVVVNFTLDDGNKTVRVPAEYIDLTKRHVAQVTNLTLPYNMSFGNWSMRIEANDSFGNLLVSTPKKLAMQDWPVHFLPESDIVVQYANGTSFAYAGNDPIQYMIRLYGEHTGYAGAGSANQVNRTDNLAFNFTTPSGVTYTRSNDTTPSSNTWEAVTRCQLGDGNGFPGGLGGTGSNVPTCTDYGIFRQSGLNRADGKPGTWNVSIIIKDLGGKVRAINRTFNLTDLLPEIRSSELFNVNQNRTADTADPYETIRVRVTTQDDFQEVGNTAFVNFTRSGVSSNFTMDRRELEPEGSRKVWLHELNITTGRGGMLGVAGNYSVVIYVKDENGNINATASTNVILNDTGAPSRINASAAPSTQELGQNVTFSIDATDDTNVTAYLQILDGTQELIPTVVLTQRDAPDLNFTYTVNFSEEGDFTWTAWVVDSAGRKSAEKPGSLRIRDNLGPKYDVKAPAFVSDAVRYGAATPRIEIVVYDTDGVDPASIVLNVGGKAVVPELGPAPNGLDGALVSYTVPAKDRFAHGEVVDVNLSAADSSTKNILSWLNFTFRVDDSPPIARMVGFDPKYRASDSHPWNVSTSTRFTLAAEDNDGLPTDVERIRFKIIGGGCSNCENVYTGPFRITDAPNVYTGPRIYQIQFWAEDSVGNYNRTFNLTTIYVDDTPPNIVQFFPQNRYINATVVDDRVGVDRVVAWHKVNDRPYTPIPLDEPTEPNGPWRVVLPEGRKGDHVSYYLQAWDRLDNTERFGNESAPYATFSVDNHEPRIQIVSPETGSTVSRTVELRWTASDEDGDALIFTVYYKPPGSRTFVEKIRLESNDARRYALDTTQLQDGQYTIRVTAADGGYVKLSETTITILNRGSAIGTISQPPPEVEPGQTVLIKAEITKAQAEVEARLYREGKLVNDRAYVMNDEGRDGDEAANDGFYSIRVPVEDAGDYRVEIYARYQEDGVTKESRVTDAATFSATLTPVFVMREYAVLLVAIALLAVGGIGAAVFFMNRRN